MSWRIREAHRSDTDFITTAQIRMAEETESLRLDPAVVAIGVGAVLDDLAKGRYFVAESASGAVVACLLTLPEWSDWRNGTVLWIHSLYVIPEYRKSGVFKAMYAHLKSMVDSSDAFRGLRLYVDKRNEAAKQAYARAGMSAEHYELFEWMK
jgi:GNAT superfamily N-acetyltransferase